MSKNKGQAHVEPDVNEDEQPAADPAEPQDDVTLAIGDENNEIDDFLKETYKDVKIAPVDLSYDRDITDEIRLLAANNPVMGEIAQAVGVDAEDMVQLAWGSSYDNTVVSDLFLAGNGEALLNIAHPAIRGAIQAEAQKASNESTPRTRTVRNQDGTTRQVAVNPPNPFFLGASRFICRVLQAEAAKQKMAFKFTFEREDNSDGQPRDRFTTVRFRHHKASDESRQRAMAAAQNSKNPTGGLKGLANGFAVS